MAAPDTETDNGLPRRTALQPAVTNSSLAGGEAPVAADPLARRPDPFAKPSLRPAPATKPGPAEPPAAASSPSNNAAIGPAKSATPAPALATSPTSADWGLAPRSRPGTWKYKIASLLGLLASAVGSYFGYQQCFPRRHATELQSPEVVEITVSEEGEKHHHRHHESKTEDPFDDALKISGDDGFEEFPNREPRKMGHPPQAAPITHGHLPQVASKKHGHHKPKTEEIDIIELDLAADDSIPPRMTQTEPDFDEEDLSGPVLERPAEKHRKMGLAGRHENHTATTTRPGHRPAAGPRINSINDRDSDLPADMVDDFADDKLDGYDLDERKHSKKTAKHHHGPKISVIDVRDEAEGDERLDGYMTDDSTTRRAVSKTKIVRSTAVDSFDENPSSDIDGDFNLGRGSHSGATPIHRKGGPPHDSRIHTNRLPADEFPETGGPPHETYRVHPDDSFWSISRKQYGSARYYQALMRHNHDRVSDPQKLRPGTHISVPPAAFLERRYPDLIEKAPAGSVPHHAANHHGQGSRPRFENPAAEREFEREFERAAAHEGGRPHGDGYFYSRSGEPMYRIGSDDTLTGIAQKHLGRASRWTEIYEQNQDILGSPDNLTLGTVIRLPSDASRLSLVPENDRRR